MMATSSDFKTWTKSRTFILRGVDYGYSRSDFRDPFVFKGDDGKWHMIVATTANNKGTLAEFLSGDLKHWTSNGQFMNMMWDRFYECPDVFKMGDWWYLVYSEKLPPTTPGNGPTTMRDFSTAVASMPARQPLMVPTDIFGAGVPHVRVRTTLLSEHRQLSRSGLVTSSCTVSYSTVMAR